MEWQTAPAFALRVTGRGQTVRLDRERLPPAANEREVKLVPQPVSKLQSHSFGLLHKRFFGLRQLSLAQFPTIQVMLCFVVKKWMCWSASGRPPAKCGGGAVSYKRIGQWNDERGRWSLWLLLWNIAKSERTEMYEEWWVWYIRYAKVPRETLSRRTPANTLGAIHM